MSEPSARPADASDDIRRRVRVDLRVHPTSGRRQRRLHRGASLEDVAERRRRVPLAPRAAPDDSGKQDPGADLVQLRKVRQRAGRKPGRHFREVSGIGRPDPVSNGPLLPFSRSLP